MNKRAFIPIDLPRGVWAVAASSTVIMSGLGMIVPLIPVYGKALGATATELGLLMAGLFAGRMLAQMPAGMATDKVGRRPVLMLATLGYAVTCGGYALCTKPELLILFRTLQGVCAGFFGVAARSLVSDLSGPRKRGTAQGVYSSSVNLGFVIGPIAAGIVVGADLPITVPFYGSAVLSVVAFVALSLIRYPKRKEPVGRDSRRPPRLELVPRLRLRIGLLAGSNLFFFAGLSVIMALFPIAGEAEIKGGIAFVGPAYAIAGMSGMLLGPLAGRLSDSAGRVPVMTLGACLAAAEGASLLLFRSPVIIGCGFFLGGIGVAAFLNSLHAALGDITRRNRRGMVTGIVGLAGEGGGMAGSILAPIVWKLTDLSWPFGLQLIFTLFSVLFMIGLGRLGPVRLTQPTPPGEVAWPE